jgi:hypothetical protein
MSSYCRSPGLVFLPDLMIYQKIFKSQFSKGTVRVSLIQWGMGGFTPALIFFWFWKFNNFKCNFKAFRSRIIHFKVLKTHQGGYFCPPLFRGGTWQFPWDPLSAMFSLLFIRRNWHLKFREGFPCSPNQSRSHTWLHNSWRTLYMIRESRQ